MSVTGKEGIAATGGDVTGGGDATGGHAMGGGGATDGGGAASEPCGVRVSETNVTGIVGTGGDAMAGGDATGGGEATGGGDATGGDATGGGGAALEPCGVRVSETNVARMVGTGGDAMGGGEAAIAVAGRPPSCGSATSPRPGFPPPAGTAPAAPPPPVPTASPPRPGALARVGAIVHSSSSATGWSRLAASSARSSRSAAVSGAATGTVRARSPGARTTIAHRAPATICTTAGVPAGTSTNPARAAASRHSASAPGGTVSVGPAAHADASDSNERSDAAHMPGGYTARGRAPADAVAQAIEAATGAMLDDLPMTPERVLAKL